MIGFRRAVALAGDRNIDVGDVAASLLRAVGLPELVTESPRDYEALALQIAGLFSSFIIHHL